VAAEMRRRREKYTDGSIPWHVISNVYITDATDREATVRSWWTFFVQSPEGEQRFSGVGWYDDVFGLEDGVWRVKRRRVLQPHDT
jgi:3-phenylpropionate/cinnamic acid dioxygenase small subunit